VWLVSGLSWSLEPLRSAASIFVLLFLTFLLSSLSILSVSTLKPEASGEHDRDGCSELKSLIASTLEEETEVV